MRILFILIIISVLSCKDKSSDFDESDYHKVQGLITKVDIQVNYVDKFKKTYHFIYGSDINNIKSSLDKNSDLILDKNDPIIVLINKTDSSEVYIAQRGTINRGLTVDLIRLSDSITD